MNASNLRISTTRDTG